MVSEKLLPCPFCGGEARYEWHSADLCWIECNACGAVGPNDTHTTTEANAAAWNTRAPAEQTGWQPIETAPRDGTEFLSAGGTQGRADRVYPTKWLSPGPYTTENGKNAVGERRFQYPEGFYWAGYDGFVGPVDPTVWCHKPAPPGTTRAPADLRSALEAETIERCAKVAEGERVDADATQNPTDYAYNLSCEHIAEAIRALAPTNGDA